MEIFFLVGGLASILSLLMPVSLILALLVILALRHDDDDDASRAPAIYAALVWFIGLFTSLIAAVGMAASLVAFSDEVDGGGHDGQASAAAAFFAVGVVTLVLLWVHRDALTRLRQGTGAARRVHRAYVLVVCLIAALVALVAGAVLIFQFYALAFPDTADTERGDAARTIVPVAVAALGACLLWMTHWDQLEVAGDGAETDPAV